MAAPWGGDGQVGWTVMLAEAAASCPGRGAARLRAAICLFARRKIDLRKILVLAL